MTKSKTTRKALLMSLVSLMLCMAMLVGTTYAWFTDSVSASVNQIVSGTLDLDLVDENGATLDGKTLSFTNKEGSADILWEPGATYTLTPFQLVNKGNLWLKYVVEIASGITSENDVAADLLDAIDFYVFENVDETTDIKAEIANGAAKTLAAYFNGEEKALAPAGEENSSSALITIAGHMKETAGNEYQGLTLDGAAINVLATQYAKEVDSFDNQYDKNATYPVIADAHYDVNTAAELFDALNAAQEGETTAIHLKQDIALETVGQTYGYTLSGNKDAIIDLAGNELTFSVDSSRNTGGILAKNIGVTVVNGTVNVESGTGFCTSGTATSHFENVTFNVAKGYGVDAVGYTEFTNCNFNVTGGYGVFCARPSTVKNCTFNVNGFNTYGIQMNNNCNGNVIDNVTIEVECGIGIYVNATSDAKISNAEISLRNSRATGIYVSSDSNEKYHSFVEIGENVTINNSYYNKYSPNELVSAAYDMVNIKFADGISFETDGTRKDSTSGASWRSMITGGTYWRSVSAN